MLSGSCASRRIGSCFGIDSRQGTGMTRCNGVGEKTRDSRGKPHSRPNIRNIIGRWREAAVNPRCWQKSLLCPLPPPAVLTKKRHHRQTPPPCFANAAELRGKLFPAGSHAPLRTTPTTRFRRVSARSGAAGFGRGCSGPMMDRQKLTYPADPLQRMADCQRFRDPPPQPFIPHPHDR